MRPESFRDGQPVDTVLAFAERVVENIDTLSVRGR
jgi:hypothetical protein